MRRASRRTRSTAVLLAGLLLATGCRTYFPVNEPITHVDDVHGYRGSRRWSSERSNELLLIVAFSGGGTRAASFAYGVLEELAATPIRIDGRDTTLFDEIDHVTGVSGGSFTAAYLGLHGRGLFDDFEERFLRRDVQGPLIWQAAGALELVPARFALLSSAASSSPATTTASSSKARPSRTSPSGMGRSSRSTRPTSRRARPSPSSRINSTSSAPTSAAIRSRGQWPPRRRCRVRCRRSRCATSAGIAASIRRAGSSRRSRRGAPSAAPS
ncbi:MAG: patatin-like phospholipase family protein [Myxococcota bacterium]